MKKRLLFGILAGAGALGVLAIGLPVAFAQSQSMNDAQVSRIRANCIAAQTTLSQLHSADGYLRVDRGTLYSSISNNLMANLNSRIALNRLDAAELTKITAQYEKDREAFTVNYKAYEEQLSSVLKIDCQKQPVAFYDGVADARAKRQAVHEAITRLNKGIQDYKKAFDAFEAQFRATEQPAGQAQ